MEAGSGVASSRGASLPISASRKEWRAVSDQHPVRNTEDEKLERVNMGQPDERTIYEHGREPIDVDFCAITMDGGLDNDVLQHRIHDIARQREDLQHMEIELKARIVARSEITGMQNSFEAQIKEHEEDIRNLQGQLQEKEQIIHNMERRIEEKDRELNAIKRDNEDAWVKEDLIREQNKELASFRRERDHSEAERAQQIQQMHELREHIQEKEQQIHELQEQHRTDQETIYLKDEQLKAWIARAQELEALQSTAHHTLQAEIRERVEQYNQLWLHCQRQFAEMERLHLHTIHQLQIELADARGKNGSYADDSHMLQTNTKDAVNFVLSSGKEQNTNGVGVTSAGNGVVPNSNSDHISPPPTGNVPSNQANNVAGLQIAPSSLLGMPAFIPPGQVTALPPFILHQQGIPQSIPSYPPQSHGHFHSVPTISSALQGQRQKEVILENAQLSSQNQLASPEKDHDVVQQDAKYNYDMVNDGQGLHPDYLQCNISHAQELESVIPSSTGEPQFVGSIETSYVVSSKSEQSLLHISSQFNDTLKLSSAEQNGESEEQKVTDGKLLVDEQSAATATVSQVPNGSVNFSEAVTDNGSSSASSEVLLPIDQSNKVAADKGSDAELLDERSLLACIVRTIPAGGRIRINSTLPNRLGKMLSPLHWHDYKKKYGKLEDFVAGHPELFSIEDDYVQLQEGAQEMIAATAAVAKVAAAALRPYSSSTSSVAVTPLAQSYRSKKELNGTTYDRTSRTNAQSKVPSFVWNQQGRATGAAFPSGR